MVAQDRIESGGGMPDSSLPPRPAREWTRYFEVETGELEEDMQSLLEDIDWGPGAEDCSSASADLYRVTVREGGERRTQSLHLPEEGEPYDGAGTVRDILNRYYVQVSGQG